MASESAALLPLACNIFGVLEVVYRLMDDPRDTSKSEYAPREESEILNGFIAELGTLGYAIDVPDSNHPSRVQKIAAEGLQICQDISGAVEIFQVAEIKPKWNDFARGLRKAWNKSKPQALRALAHLHKLLVGQTYILLRGRISEIREGMMAIQEDVVRLGLGKEEGLRSLKEDVKALKLELELIEKAVSQPQATAMKKIKDIQDDSDWLREILQDSTTQRQRDQNSGRFASY
ncbi:hypothetical protein DL98DRAFT_149967 [Cadophora sp. DSE1049]|nr:hypothetical protein DL98DRAFT_149967 [Cadophora sp. DSE1049]